MSIKRKIMSIFVSVLVISGMLGINVNAVSERTVEQYREEYIKHETILEFSEYVEVAQYAYMDLDMATEPLKNMIINARNKIIFSESWTAQAGMAWVETETGEIEELPAFYSLFPEDWELPTENNPVTMYSEEFADENNSVTPCITYSQLFNGNVTVRAAGNSNASSFYNWQFALPHVTRVYATSIPGSTINFGFTTNGVSVAHKVNMSVNEKLSTRLLAQEGDRHSVRCSTYSTTGTAKVVVDYAS